ncbi:hypothetical protein JCM11641_006700 [Rhodosporidiobolus odoratus]
MFRSPASDLADFLRSYVTPRTFFCSSSSRGPGDREWEELRARQGGTKRLDFFDHQLDGPSGAVEVLRAIEKSPGVTDIALSHNALRDDGLRELLVGLKRLRTRDIGAHLEELNLSDCDLTDVSLHLITLHLLQPSPHPPSLRSLYLNHNHLSLGTSLKSLPEFLGSTLSSPSCSLRSLALTSNRQVQATGFIRLLAHLNLAAGPSQLAELRLSVTALTPESAEPLAKWLEDPQGGARLQVLAINACGIGTAGVRRIAAAVTGGKASSILHLECLANEDGDDERWAATNVQLAAQDIVDPATDWKEQVEAAQRRNQQVFRETQHVALSLLAKARVLLLNAREGNGTDDAGFPFARLPIELRVHILRCCPFLTPSRSAHLYPPITASPCQANTPTPDAADATLSSILTEAQFLRIIAYAASTASLETEGRIAVAHAAGEAPSLSGKSSVRGEPDEEQRRRETERDAGNGWEEFFLRTTGCDRFERAVLL